MICNIFHIFFETIKNQSKYPLSNTKSTFNALVDAIIPMTPETSENQRSIQLYGALASHTDEYEIWSLDHILSLNITKLNFNIYLANATAKMLNIAAKQLIDSVGNKEPINFTILHEQGAFAALAPNDRFRVIALLEQNKVDITLLPIPFRNNPGFILSLTGGISMFATIGYYTEWSGYGSSRMNTPEKQKFEHFPIGWKQSGYPGPSKGYHAFRGYLVEKYTE